MKILLCYANNATAQKALELTIEYGKIMKPHIDIVTSQYGKGHEGVDEVNRAEKELKIAEKILIENGIACKTHFLVRGIPPGQDLVKFSEENKIDLIVLGVKVTSNIGRFFFGSTSQHILHEAKCPVLVVR